jgi:transposase
LTDTAWVIKKDSTMKKEDEARATPRRYDEAFKQEAVRLWITSGRSAETTARELGLSVFDLYKWRKTYAIPPLGAAPPAPKTMAGLQSENERLRREVERLTEQRDILKKAAGILSEPPRSGMPGSR